ncbi:MAG: Hpt domain-containing protein [Acidobacteria bacterium]|nr:Hpt domain-containing protein [Acidobacteriota bacterium]
MPENTYPGPERRKFRRFDLHYPVHIKSVAKADSAPTLVADGVTVNLSFGGALVGLSDTNGLQDVMPVNLHFVAAGGVSPEALSGVVWRLEHLSDDDKVAVEFDAPLMAYEGAVELADRLEWLRDKMGGDDFVHELVELFLDTVPDTIRRARVSQHNGDLEAVAQIARSLKSSAGNIGAVNLYEVARRAEQAAREGDAATAARHVDALQRYFDSIKGQLEDAC